MDAEQPHIIEFKRITDRRGDIAVVSQDDGCPFAIRRVFWIFDIPADAVRGGHAHYGTTQLIVAAAGHFEVEVSDGITSRIFSLEHPGEGLLLPPGYWRSLKGFSAGCVCLTLCDTDFEEADYMRDYDSFLRFKGIGEK